MYRQIAPRQCALPSIVLRRGARNYLSVQRARERLPDLLAEHPGDWDEFAQWVDQIEAWRPGRDSAALGFSLLAHAPLPADAVADDFAVRSPRERHGNPIYHHMLEGSRQAQIIVHTHATSVINASQWHAVLENDDGPPLSVVIFDEADLIESAADLVSRRRLQPRELAAHAREWHGDKTIALSRKVEKALALLEKTAEDAVAWLDTVRPRNDKEENKRMDTGFALSGEHKQHEAPARIRAQALLKATQNALSAVKSPDGEEPPPDQNPDGKKAREACLAEMREWIETLDQITEALAPPEMTQEELIAGARKPENKIRQSDTYKQVIGLNWSPAHSWGSFEIKDLYPARRLGTHWAYKEGDDGFASHTDSVIFTSATMRSLTRSNPWLHMQIALGLRAPNGVTRRPHNLLEPKWFAPSRFGRIEKVFLAHPSAPRPRLKGVTDDGSWTDLYETNPEFLDYCAGSLNLVANAGGPALVLTASYSDAAGIEERLSGNLRTISHIHKQRGIRDLDTGVRRIIDGTARMLVTPSAWQGKDIRGPGKTQVLKHVVVTRLQIPAPEGVWQDAMRKAGLEKGRSAQEVNKDIFARAICIAFFRLRQGIGRLLRGPNDTGCIWILDPRVGLPGAVLRFNQDLAHDMTVFPGMLEAFPERFRCGDDMGESVLDRCVLVRPVRDEDDHIAGPVVAADLVQPLLPAIAV